PLRFTISVTTLGTTRGRRKLFPVGLLCFGSLLDGRDRVVDAGTCSIRSLLDLRFCVFPEAFLKVLFAVRQDLPRLGQAGLVADRFEGVPPPRSVAPDDERELAA